MLASQAGQAHKANVTLSQFHVLRWLYQKTIVSVQAK